MNSNSCEPSSSPPQSDGKPQHKFHKIQDLFHPNALPIANQNNQMFSGRASADHKVEPQDIVLQQFEVPQFDPNVYFAAMQLLEKLNSIPPPPLGFAPGLFLEQTKQKPMMTLVSPAELKDRFKDFIENNFEKPSSKKRGKATNIPKFVLKIFANNLPAELPENHKNRIRQFFRNLPSSKTRFDMLKLFGRGETPDIEEQNQTNRDILRRLLNKSYDNILSNKHIRSKKLYLMFCKKIILRLSEPAVIDRLEV